MKSVCHSWPPSPERVWEGFLLLPGEISLHCSLWMGAAVAVLGAVVAGFLGKLAVFGGACGPQKLETEKSLALAFGALHPLLPTAHLSLATCPLWSRDSGFSLVVQNSVAQGGAAFRQALFQPCPL